MDASIQKEKITTSPFKIFCLGTTVQKQKLNNYFASYFPKKQCVQVMNSFPSTSLELSDMTV